MTHFAGGRSSATFTHLELNAYEGRRKRRPEHQRTARRVVPLLDHVVSTPLPLNYDLNTYDAEPGTSKHGEEGSTLLEPLFLVACVQTGRCGGSTNLL